MALQMITGVIGDGMTYERIAELTTACPSQVVQHNLGAASEPVPTTSTFSTVI
jgi:N-acetylglutamate synthase/N-acetylornithine aminotransferase